MAFAANRQFHGTLSFRFKHLQEIRRNNITNIMITFLLLLSYQQVTIKNQQHSLTETLMAQRGLKIKLYCPCNQVHILVYRLFLG